MPENWNERGRSAAKRGTETAANGIHTVTNFVDRNADRVAGIDNTSSQTFALILPATMAV